MRDHYDSKLGGKGREKIKCLGSLARPNCTETLIRYGQVKRCLDCRDSVTRENQKLYAVRRRQKEKAVAPIDAQPST